MSYLVRFFSLIMDRCYDMAGNYGMAIILFTFISKVIILPVTLWTYFNSIKMVKIQPDINMLKVKYYGQNDVIAEKQTELQKKAGYHPLLSTVPLVIQLFLLMGVVEVIKAGIAEGIIDMSFGPVDLGMIPREQGITYIWVPFVAGLTSFILCLVQDKFDILQSQQSTGNKIFTMAVSVGLSLYLGFFVYIGTALYWVAGNCFAVLQLFILNGIVRPKRFVDQEALSKSREELDSIKRSGKRKGEGFFSPVKRRERADYKRFFKVVNKHIVFYSESNGFYKYFRGYIDYLLLHTKLTIHYITSDPDDGIFVKAQSEPRIRPYYIGENRLITLMMKMDADMVVMTMPDLGKYHIKRSYVRKDTEYVFVQHGMGSNNLTFRQGATDNFDTVFCVGEHQYDEEVEAQKLYDLPERKILKIGYPLIDDMRADHEMKTASGQIKGHARPLILIAPSWQKDNIIDLCLDDILQSLKDGDYDVIVRPHPQEVRIKAEKMQSLTDKYKDASNIEIQTDFSSNNPVMEADVLITDWSDIACEYAFTTMRPVLYINTPMKVMNPEWEKLPVVPINIYLRDKIGMNLDTGDLSRTRETVDHLLAHSDEYRKTIGDMYDRFVYNHGSSAEEGARYIISSLQEKIAGRKKEEKR